MAEQTKNAPPHPVLGVAGFLRFWEYLVMSTPAGWYPHPTMPGTQQYWDGAQWTSHVAPGPVAVPGVYVTQNLGKAYKTSHGFHLIMTVVTVGLWGIFVWLPVGIYNSVRNGK